MTKVKKNRYRFWSMDMNLKPTQCINFMDAIGMGIHVNHRAKRQQKRYKDACQIDRLFKNNGWDTKYNLVSTWECEEPILKKV